MQARRMEQPEALRTALPTVVLPTRRVPEELEQAEPLAPGPSRCTNNLKLVQTITALTVTC